MDLRLRTSNMDGVTVLSVGGEVDLHSAPQLKAELIHLSETTPIRLALDLNDVSFIDSTGVGTLVGALKRVREKGGKIVFYGANARVRRVFEITGLLRALPLAENRESALQMLKAPQAEPVAAGATAGAAAHAGSATTEEEKGDG